MAIDFFLSTACTVFLSHVIFYYSIKTHVLAIIIILCHYYSSLVFKIVKAHLQDVLLSTIKEKYDRMI